MTTKDKPEWIVNDIAELGVLVNGRAFFLCKGDSLEYDDPTHDDGTPLLYRPVFKREFGECCHPKDYWTADGRCRYPETYTVGDGWRPLSELSSAKPEAIQAAPGPDLATIVAKCGDLGIKAIAAMANVSEDDVRRALAQDDGPRGQLVKVRDRLRETFAWGRSGAPTAMEMVTVACDEHHGTKREMLGLLQLLGFDADALPIGNKERLAAELLDKRWVLREDVERPSASGPIYPPDGWYMTSTGGRDGGSDVLGGPGECRIRIEPWGFAVTDADGDEAAAGVAAMRCAMAIHERRYGGASDPSTVAVQVLTSADIERLTRFLYWLTSSVGWLDVRSIIADSEDDAMTSPGAEALARELVAELLRKNGGDHGLG